MAVIAVCIALVVVGVVMVVRWGGHLSKAPTEFSRGARGSAARALRYVGVSLAAGLAAGVLAAGAGGRLVMRLLAATSPEAKGSITEASEIVGRITVDGTLGFFVFVGLPAGFLSGALYALVGPLLPPGRVGGVALGALLLVLAGTRLDPLRADNPDFLIVGPAWLAVITFTALGLFQGMLVTALAARMSRHSSLAPPIAHRQQLITASRIALGVIVLAALPSFLGAVADILG
jgi:hypothetical protein